MLNGQAGQDLHGYRRKEITQLQTTLTHFFDQVMGAERLTLVGEIGWTHVGGLESTSKARYGRDPVFGPGPLPGTISGLASCQALNISTRAPPKRTTSAATARTMAIPPRTPGVIAPVRSGTTTTCSWA